MDLIIPLSGWETPSKGCNCSDEGVLHFQNLGGGTRDKQLKLCQFSCDWAEISDLKRSDTKTTFIFYKKFCTSSLNVRKSTKILDWMYVCRRKTSMLLSPLINVCSHLSVRVSASASASLSVHLRMKIQFRLFMSGNTLSFLKIHSLKRQNSE